jgi:hypothetical protein
MHGYERQTTDAFLQSTRIYAVSAVKYVTKTCARNHNNKDEQNPKSQYGLGEREVICQV